MFSQVLRNRKPYSAGWFRTRSTQVGTRKRSIGCFPGPKDGSGQPAPRELIHLLSSLREGQLRRIEVGHDEPADEMLFDRASFKDALRQVSEVRLKQTLYAEYPEFREYVAALEGAKSQQSTSTLARAWGVDETKAREIADHLVDIGFFERRGVLSSPDYWVPFLYRDALHLVQGEARLDG